MSNKFIVTGALLLVISDNAFAYIDPGTGSVAIQAIFAIVASSYFWLGSAMTRIKLWFSYRSGEK